MALVIALLGAACTLWPHGCTRQEPPAPIAPVPRVALVRRGAGDSFWRSVRAGAARAAREAGRVEIVARNAPIPTDGDSQAALVRDLIQDHVGAIVLAPSQTEALSTALQDARAAGLTVVLIDNPIEPPQDVGPAVASDNARAGELAAEFLIKSMGGPGVVLVVGDGQGGSGADGRERAFRRRMESERGITLVSAPPAPGGPVRRAAQLAVEYTMDAQKETRAIYCPDEQTTQGALQALRDRSAAGRVHLVGTDTNPTLVEAMAAGEIDALVVQKPIDIGYQAVRAALAGIKGQAPPPRTLTGVTIITRAVMHEPANMDLLLPDLAGADD